MIQQVEGKSHIVIKRDGRSEPYNREKLYAVILWACDNSTLFADQLIDAVDIKIHNKIHISKLYDEVISTAANLISDLYPKWEEVAKNLYLLKIHKDLGVKRAEYPSYHAIVKMNEDAGLYDSTHPFMTPANIEKLQRAINPEYDSLFTFGGLNIFVQKYCNRVKGQSLELPQHVYMRIAVQLMYKDGLEAVLSKYHQLASHSVTEATPKVVNSLRKNASMFSCCLVRPSDSLEGITESINMLAKESKYSGGCAWDASLLRAPGSVVEGNNGTSGGTKQYIKGLQETISGFNQGNTRSSACIVTFDSFHYEAPEMVHLKHESGKDEDRARKLQYSVKWRPELSKAILSDSDIYLVDPHKTQDLFESFGDTWAELYDKACRNTHIRKRKYNARELAFDIVKTSFETGNLYFFFPDNSNKQDIGAGYIPASNLCVAGNTQILTQDGYKPISTLAGQTVSCWNGEEWSDTPIFQTSDSEHVLTVKLSNGQTIQATDYHKWYIAEQDKHGGLLGYKEVRTHELQPGDKLIKHELEPVTHGTLLLENAYENGFVTADGTDLSNGVSHIYLYDTKKQLLPHFSSYSSITEQPANDSKELRVTLRYHNLLPKFFVPDTSYSVKSRLTWLAGYFDGDATLTNNQGSESIQVSSTNHEFLRKVYLLLQELGIQSKVVDGYDACYRLMPSNDGIGGSKEYWCKGTKRLLIPGSELQKLLRLGYSANRVQPTTRYYNRSALQFTQIVSVEDDNEYMPVYCGTEPKRNKLMFNGVLTGNCQEMMMSYEPIKLVSNKLSDTKAVFEFEGDIALCNLASINLMKWITLSATEKESFMYLLVKSADNAIDNSFYTNPLGRKHSFQHRNLGIGTSNYANMLASNKLLWNSEGARKLTHTVYEEISFYAIKASIELAKERSRCPVFEQTKWAQGLFPHELSVLGAQESTLNYPLLMDWDSLRSDLLRYGIRNSRLLAIAPTATSGKAINATEGVDAPRKLKTIQEGTYSLPFVVPNLRENREYYQTTFEIDNKDTIELAAIRQKFLCMSQSVSLAYQSSKSAYEAVSNIIYAETLGLKTIYYTYTKKADDETIEVCESCGS